MRSKHLLEIDAHKDGFFYHITASIWFTFNPGTPTVCNLYTTVILELKKSKTAVFCIQFLSTLFHIIRTLLFQVNNVIVAGNNRSIIRPYGCSSGRHSPYWFRCQLSWLFCFLLVNNDLSVVICLLHAEMVSWQGAEIQYVIILIFLCFNINCAKVCPRVHLSLYGLPALVQKLPSFSSFKYLLKPISLKRPSCCLLLNICCLCNFPTSFLCSFCLTYILNHLK